MDKKELEAEIIDLKLRVSKLEMEIRLKNIIDKRSDEELKNSGNY